MELLEAILVAEATIKFGDSIVSKLKGFNKKTISRKEFKELFELPDFESFSEKRKKEKEDTSE